MPRLHMLIVMVIYCTLVVTNDMRAEPKGAARLEITIGYLDGRSAFAVAKAVPVNDISEVSIQKADLTHGTETSKWTQGVEYMCDEATSVRLPYRWRIAS